jgi:hypothetical protein
MMDTRTNQKKWPASMIFISVVFIVISLLLISHVIENIITTPAVFEMTDLMRRMEADVPVYFLMMIFFFKNFYIFGSLEVIFSIFIIAAVVNLLLFKSWARIALEISAWVLVFTILLYLSFWTLTVFTMPNVMAGFIGTSDISTMKFGYILLLLVLLVFLITPLFVSVYLLRSQRIREIFDRA